MKLINKGAEANLYLDKDTIIKDRVKKAYRVRELDESLRRSRTKREARLISFARRVGVPTPVIRDVDENIVKMDFIKGKQVKKILNLVSKEERKRLCEEIGKHVGRLHENNVIHGDLTTSNMILKEERIFFIDFGLGEINDAVEAKGVDLLVFKKSLRSTHYEFEGECFDAFVKGYSSEYEDYGSVLERLSSIEKRGRYFAKR